MNLPRFLFPVIALLAINCPDYAQSFSYKESQSYFTGSINNNQYKIEMSLYFAQDSVYGSYFYESTGLPIPLTGTLLTSGELRLNEWDSQNQVTATFIGEKNTLGFEGQWKILTGHKLFPFSLVKVADYQLLDFSNDSLDATSFYPVFTSSNKLLQKITAQIQDSSRYYLKKFISEGEKISQEEKEYFSGWTLKYIYDIKYYSDNLISLVNQVFEFTGGAHPNTYYQSLNFSLESNSLIDLKLSDLFIDNSGYISSLSNFIINDLRQKEAAWVINGDIKQFQAADLSTFYITPKSLEFVFAPYAVGSYSEGTYTVSVPFSVIRKYIKPSGPLNKFL